MATVGIKGLLTAGKIYRVMLRNLKDSKHYKEGNIQRHSE